MQHQFIPKVPFTLYHATSTGENLEILRSFASQGINPTIAKGHGQGEGFYMWSTKKLALKHLRYLEGEGKIKGNKLLVRVQTTLNPQEWDLDAEDNASFILQFLYESWNELFMFLPDMTLEVYPGRFLSIVKTKKHSPNRIQFFFLPKVASVRRFMRTLAYGGDEYSIPDGEMLGKIFTFIQKLHPVKCYEFECSVFDKSAHNPGLGVKYVGNDILPIDKMWARVDDKWEDALNLLV